jgi:murein DD-endopeptidase MepM/ murein hydrolase activator NlpD
MKKFLKYSWLISLLFWSQVQANFVQTEAVPGGVVEFRLNFMGEMPPTVMYAGQRVAVIRDQQGWHAVLGIPLTAKLGTHTFEFNGKTYQFTVQDKAYPTQQVRLNNKRQVNPNAEDMQRITLEKQQISAALSQKWTDWVGEATLPLQKPVNGTLGKGRFGARRVFNGQPRQPHTGLDLTIAQGTPILAPADGVVVDVGDYFFNGNTVFLSHGQGLITMYCHLNDFAVKVGQQVRRGDTLGTVGMTGRATGPHLHWGVWLNHTWVNPELVTRF